MPTAQPWTLTRLVWGFSYFGVYEEPFCKAASAAVSRHVVHNEHVRHIALNVGNLLQGFARLRYGDPQALGSACRAAELAMAHV